jgi:hypothetical protein
MAESAPPPGVDARRVEWTQRYFDRFGRVEAAAQRSPVYEQLSALVAADVQLATLAAESRAGQPPANLFFAAVHALLLAGAADHPLAAYYASVGGTRSPDPGLDVAFRDFVLAHRDPLRVLLHTRLVQTNEVRRCGLLLPAFRAIGDDAAVDAGGAPLALVEIGPSAGLNLLFDRYRYDYSGTPAGDPASPLHLDVEVRGAPPPVTPVPAVASRLGIDLHALDVRSERDVRWLEALTWPEHEERRRVLRAAVGVARADPPRVVSGDVFDLLPGAFAAAPPGAAATLVATFVLNQFDHEMRDRLRDLVLAASRRRPIWCVLMGADQWVGAPPAADGAVHLWLVRARDGEGVAQRLATADPHGWWIEWDPGPVRAWPPGRSFA